MTNKCSIEIDFTSDIQAAEKGKAPLSKITGSCGKPNCGSVQNSEEEITLEIDVQAKNKGLWYNIQQKKKRMGKNYFEQVKGEKNIK